MKKFNIFFREIFNIIRKIGFKIFINSDIMFYNNQIQEEIKKRRLNITEILIISIKFLFKNYKNINGIIWRIGESDGLDVNGEFKSKVVIKTVYQLRSILKKILPFFEKRGKLCIMRTWTVGKNRIGDLIWNEKTYKKVFDSIKSENLVISMKYGEGDFFRFFEANDLFFVDDKMKIVEFQARREYEGFGEFPCFIGWEYEEIIKKLHFAKNIIGISVWAQTGGWSRFYNLTFFKKSSIWNELNFYTSLKLFKQNWNAEECIKNFLRLNFKGKKIAQNSDKFIRFLKNSNIVINDLLYDPIFSREKLYFNRIRIPPLLHIFWDNVTITELTFIIMNAFVIDKKACIEKMLIALKNLREMNKLRKDIGLRYNYRFHYKTFKLFFLIKLLIYSRNKKRIIGIFENEIKSYREEFPKGYKFHIHYKIKKTDYLIMKNVSRFLIRRDKKYRIRDKILFNPVTKIIFKIFIKLFKDHFPKFINNQAMPIDTFL